MIGHDGALEHHIYLGIPGTPNVHKFHILRKSNDSLAFQQRVRSYSKIIFSPMFKFRNAFESWHSIGSESDDVRQTG